jgi:aerobic-type carbon monoxide dehydrogenase small subunit (CoxS/CutS family)
MTDGPEFELTLTIDDRTRSAQVDPRSTLVDALRDNFGVTGPKIGCRTGDCGACTVRVDGAIAKSCLRLAVAEQGSTVCTIESMGGRGRPGTPGSELTALQTAFWDLNAFQCGFCLSGMLFAAEDLLERIPVPTEAQVRDAISGNLCRCTGYDAIVDAVLRCAAEPG